MNNINPALESMIEQKKLSGKKLEKLAFLKSFIDKISGCDHLEKAEVDKVESQYGVKPDIITWGDYFQSRIAADHWNKSDQEFDRIIHTIRFDMIAAVMIFEKKTPAFIRMVQDKFEETLLVPENERNMEEQEYFHLGIILNYYQNLKLKIAAFHQSDFEFFREYSLDQAVS